ncbi:MAG TPA: SMP-30/gluconolactonase/LRE family protein [Pseudonocardiaceae bacterium]
MALEVAVGGRTTTGAGPVWDVTSGTVLWVEFGGEVVHRFNPATGHDDPLGLPQPVAAANPRRLGGLVLTLRDGVAVLDPDGTRRWLVYWAREGVAGTAAAVDRAGRLWVATAGDGALLRIEPDGTVRLALHGADVSAIAFSPDAGTMYLADMAGEFLVAADFDPQAGEVGPRRPLRPARGGPSTLCVDVEGSLWVTARDGSAIRRYRPDGSPQQAITIGGAHPTGCTFGGTGLTDLYLTAAPQRQAATSSGPLLVIPDAGEGLPTPVFAG